MSSTNSDRDPFTHDAVVFGAGITGLSCAYRLHQAGLRALVLESAERVGGSIRTERQDGYLLEIGPNSYRQKPEARRLVEEVGLSADLLEQPSRDHPRFIFDGRALREVPTGLLSFVRTPLLSWRGKLRLLREPFLTTRPPADESVADFIRRHLGPEMLEMFVAPFVSGVYAGDPEKMSMPAAIPLQYGFAARRGSMVRGFFDYMKERKRERRSSGAGAGGSSTGDRRRRGSFMCSFREGLEQLPQAISRRLGGNILTGVNVTGIKPLKKNGGRGYEIFYSGRESVEPVSVRTRTMIFATPAYAAVPLLKGWNEPLSEAVSAITYLPLVVLHAGVSLESVVFRPRGFGFLVPRGRGVRALGCLWTSAMFPGRSPDGHALLTIFYGGATDPTAIGLTDEDLWEQARQDIGVTMGWNGQGRLLRITRWDKALPDYCLGYMDKLKHLRKLAAACSPPVFFAGNYMGRISLPDCIRTAGETAAEVIRILPPPNR